MYFPPIADCLGRLLLTNVRFVGIACAGSDTLVTGNYLEGCGTGINATYCPGSLVAANVVRCSRVASIRVLNNAEGLVVRGNTFDMLEAMAAGTTKPRGIYVMEDNFVV